MTGRKDNIIQNLSVKETEKLVTDESMRQVKCRTRRSRPTSWWARYSLASKPVSEVWPTPPTETSWCRTSELWRRPHSPEMDPNKHQHIPTQTLPSEPMLLWLSDTFETSLVSNQMTSWCLSAANQCESYQIPGRLDPSSTWPRTMSLFWRQLAWRRRSFFRSSCLGTTWIFNKTKIPRCQNSSECFVINVIRKTSDWSSWTIYFPRVLKCIWNLT